MADAAEESPAQRAARLRREKREKKITGGGSDRLARITNVSGRQQDLQPTPPKPTVADDPGDVDIPHIPSVLTSSPHDDPPTSGLSSEDAARLRAALRSQQPSDRQQGPPGTGADDPMVKMMEQMQQMLGLPAAAGGGGGGGGGGPAGGPGSGPAGAGGPELPPALASLLVGQPVAPGEQQAPSTSGYVWRIVHALFALGLGLYIVLIMPFTGSKSDRLVSGEGSQSVFWIFATAELGLQSARYLLERGNPPQGGMLLTVAGFLPEPYKGYLQLLSRYSTIYTTLVEDAMMVVFMLGVVIWWRNDLVLEL